MLGDKVRAIADRSLATLYNLEQRAFDLCMGSSTGGIGVVTADSVQSGLEDWPYQGCEWPASYFALKALRPGPTDVFVDLGSGKDKALLIAGRLPYEHDWLVSTGRVVVENVRSETWPSTRRWWEDGDVIVTYHVTGKNGSTDTSRCLIRKKKPSSEAMIRWSGPNGQRFRASDPGKCS